MLAIASDWQLYMVFYELKVEEEAIQPGVPMARSVTHASPPLVYIQYRWVLMEIQIFKESCFVYWNSDLEGIEGMI